MLLMATAALATAILRCARLYLIQQSLCRSHLLLTGDPALVAPDGSIIDQSLCKANGIQADLALVSGVFEVGTLLCGLLATPVWTRLAGRLGRQSVLVVNVVGMVVGGAYGTAVCEFFFFSIFFPFQGSFGLLPGEGVVGVDLRSTRPRYWRFADANLKVPCVLLARLLPWRLRHSHDLAGGPLGTAGRRPAGAECAVVHVHRGGESGRSVRGAVFLLFLLPTLLLLIWFGSCVVRVCVHSAP